MATNFPGGIDTFVNPNATSSLDSPSHSGLHTDLGDAMTAVETQLVNSPYGLVHIKTESVGSAVSSVSINDVFSSTYKKYRIICKLNAVSNNDSTMRFRLRVSGTDNDSSNYRTGGVFVGLITSLSLGSQNAATETFFTFGNANDTSGIFSVIDLDSPFETRVTSFICSSAGGYYRLQNGITTVTTSYTGFTLSPSAGTITGGVIQIYGYKE
jgi:hypothetical protein